MFDRGALPAFWPIELEGHLLNVRCLMSGLDCHLSRHTYLQKISQLLDVQLENDSPDVLDRGREFRQLLAA